MNRGETESVLFASIRIIKTEKKRVIEWIDVENNELWSCMFNVEFRCLVALNTIDQCR